LHITYYFRWTFAVADPASVASLTAKLLRDDGAVVYLNGHFAFSDNMPEGPVGYRTVASVAVGGTDQSTFFEKPMETTYLQAGTNLIASEIHQSSGSSSDLSFDFQLDALAFPANRSPTVDAGTNCSVALGESLLLRGTFNDDGLPNPPGVVSFRWQVLTEIPARPAPGPVEIADPIDPDRPSRYYRVVQRPGA
jgi:hypothetical protein